MTQAFICDAIRTPIGRYAGALSSVRADDLAAIPIKALIDRNPDVDWAELDDVILGCANQAGEDNRNLARMLLLGRCQRHRDHKRTYGLWMARNRRQAERRSDLPKAQVKQEQAANGCRLDCSNDPSRLLLQAVALQQADDW